MSGPCASTPVKFKLRRDTSVNWTSTNPVLALGEPGVETNTGQMKIGDGVHGWNSLQYVGNGLGPTGPTGPAGTGGVSGDFDGGTPFTNYGPIPAIIDAGGVV